MKTITSLLLFFWLTPILFCQNVGIHIINPEYSFDLRSKSNEEPAQLNISNPDKSRYFRLFSGSVDFPDPSLTIAPGRSLLFASFDDNTFNFNEYMRISNSGNVGIGMVNPDATLDIKGGKWNLDSGSPGDLRIGNANFNFRLGIATEGVEAGTTRMYSQGGSLLLGANNKTGINLGVNGNVTIGQDVTKGRLEINSGGLSDTLLLLKNTVPKGDIDYGIYFDDENSNSTIGAYFNVDQTAIQAASDCIDCHVISAHSNSISGTLSAIYGESMNKNGIGVKGTVSSTETGGYGVGVYGEVVGGGAGVRGMGTTGVSGSGTEYGVFGSGSTYGVSGSGTYGVFGSGSTYGVSGLGNTYGVYGDGNTYGVYGYGFEYGVYGYGNFGVGVYGSGSTGVYGYSSLPNGTAIEALQASNTGSNTAIRGVALSTDGTGIYGQGKKIGIFGYSDSTDGTAIDALQGSTTGITIGVRGVAESSQGTGIYGQGNHRGVIGFSDSSTSTAIEGIQGSTTGTTYGVRGTAESSEGTGVYGEGTTGVYGTGGTGVWGNGSTGLRGDGTTTGVYASGETAIYADGNSTGVYGAGETGVYGHSSHSTGAGVVGSNNSTTGTNFGVHGRVNSSYGTGVYGEAKGVDGTGVKGEAKGTGPYGIGVYGIGHTGVHSLSNSSTGTALIAHNSSLTGSTYGIRASVYSNDGIGILGSGRKTGVHGLTLSTNPLGIGVKGESSGQSGKALYGEATGEYGKGLHVKVTSTHSSANGILSEWGGGSSYAAYFVGRVHVAGVLSKSSGSFKIDHPLDPENKYLSHSFVESPDMMNIYNGNIITDNSGNALVTLPDYFEALNMDFRYQLTVIGQFANAIISQKINHNTFEIKTDKPSVEVSWQVTGIRKDAFAEKNRIKVEEEKEDENKGTYLNPGAYDSIKANNN